MPAEASFEAVVDVVDEVTLRAFARELNPDLDGDMTVEEALREVLVNPRVAPLDAGYEIRDKVVVHDYAARYRAKLDAFVDDPDKLVDAAQESHRLAWGGDELEAENLGQALYEHVQGSNASPPNLQVGFEIVDSWYEGPAIATSNAPAP